jgi:hypothetical protein
MSFDASDPVSNASSNRSFAEIVSRTLSRRAS